MSLRLQSHIPHTYTVNTGKHEFSIFFPYIIGLHTVLIGEITGAFRDYSNYLQFEMCTMIIIHNLKIFHDIENLVKTIILKI